MWSTENNIFLVLSELLLFRNQQLTLANLPKPSLYSSIFVFLQTMLFFESPIGCVTLQAVYYLHCIHYYADDIAHDTMEYFSTGISVMALVWPNHPLIDRIHLHRAMGLQPFVRHHASSPWICLQLNCDVYCIWNLRENEVPFRLKDTISTLATCPISNSTIFGVIAQKIRWIKNTQCVTKLYWIYRKLPCMLQNVLLR